MKIVDLHITGLTGGTVDGGWPQGNKPDEDLNTIIEVVTDEGLSGVGSAMTSKALIEAAGRLAHAQVGRSGNPDRSGIKAVEPGEVAFLKKLQGRVNFLSLLGYFRAEQGPGRDFQGDAHHLDGHVAGFARRPSSERVLGNLHHDCGIGGQSRPIEGGLDHTPLP